MPWDLYLAYVVACAVLLAVPGPTIMLVVTYALAQGRRAALPIVVGVAVGDAAAILLSFLGLGALLAASATAFTVVKWAGAAYLVYLGIRLWLAEPRLDTGTAERSAASGRATLLHCAVVTALNPKGIVFFVAFLPQFVDPSAPLVPQLALLGGTFVGLGLVNATLYVLTATAAREHITSPGLLRVVNRTGGTLLIGAGALTAAMRRAG